MELKRLSDALIVMSDAAANFTRHLLSYGHEIHAVVAAADAAPTDSELNAYAAAATLFAMTPAAYNAAAPYLQRAEAFAKAPEERLLAHAMQAWHRGEREQAISLLRQRLELRPDDLASLKICQLLHLDLGDFPGMVETTRSALTHHADNHFVLGQLAFALEEAGQSQEAGRFAERAIAGAEESGEDDPWSVHAYMHTQHRKGSLQHSIDLVHRFEPLWERCGSFMHLHAWWHAGISLLDLDQCDAAMRVYDERLADADAECVQSLVARVSLLARMELRDIDVGERWRPLQHALHERAGDGINGFLDVHYVYGLALAGDAVAAREAAGRLKGLSGRAASALVAHAQGRYEEAARAMAALEPELHRLGGSHEQRQLYELVELDAALKAGISDCAATILERDRSTRPAWQHSLATARMPSPGPGSVPAPSALRRPAHRP